MPGASISRWTMAYFAASLVCLATALLLLGSGFGTPLAAPDAPDTLVVVHLVTVGWLGLLFSGALLQFVPVLAATWLRMAGLALPALLAISCGLILLEIGFLSLGGHLDIGVLVMPVGALLLMLGFGCVILMAAATIVSEEAFDVSGILVLFGLVALAVTIILGIVFSGLISGIMDMPSWAERLSIMVPYHAASGLLGWMTLTAIGVSYRLFAMFMLSPEGKGSGKVLVRLAVCALIALYSALALAIVDLNVLNAASVSALGLSIVVAMLYCRDAWQMIKARRRKVLELNSIAGLVSLVFLPSGLLLLSSRLIFGGNPRLALAAFYVLGLGWLSGLGLAQLYKIIPFLTWLETYGAIMGKHRVPRVQDLVDERTAKVWFVVFYSAVGIGAGAILLSAEATFRVASWAQCAAVVALALEYIRARRLAYAPDPLRLPPGAVRPHLIHAPSNSRE